MIWAAYLASALIQACNIAIYVNVACRKVKLRHEDGGTIWLDYYSVKNRSMMRLQLGCSLAFCVPVIIP
jgi:hypothetical protein